jgi:hypothetical protein
MVSQSGRLVRGEVAKYSMPRGWNVTDGIVGRGEYIVLEECRPGATGGRG